MENVKSNPRMLGAAAATAVLLASGLAPVAAAPDTSASAVVKVAADIALAGNAVVDGLESLAGMAAFDDPGTAEAFDISGLLNAEFAAAQGFFNSLFSLPATLINDVENLIGSLTDLNFGMAFSALVAIPQDIVNYVLGLPGMVVNTLYEMAVVLPGEFLFNFG